MSVFRKRCKGFSMPSVGGSVVRDLRTVTTFEDGVEVTKEVLLDVSEKDYFDNHPVCMEDFSLMEQLNAGVSLKEIPCGTLLDSNDNLDYAENEVAEEKALEIVEKFESETKNND